MNAKQEQRKVRSIVPEWMGNFPFAPDKKRAVVISKDKVLPWIYGRGPNQIIADNYISTDKIYLGDFRVSPGKCFEPPDLHGGDEVYYILEGEASVLDPVKGDVFELKEGDAFLIPKGTWHQTYNFSTKELRILCFIAPKVWLEEDMGTEIEFPGTPRFLKNLGYGGEK